MIVTLDPPPCSRLWRAPGYCAQGGREWFAYYGLDWGAFVRHGIEADAIEATGDALGLHLVAFARAEAARGQ